MKRLFCVALLLFTHWLCAEPAPPLTLPKLTTRLGDTYLQATLSKANAFDVTVTHSEGVLRVKLADLSEELQKRYGYDPKAADKELQLRKEARDEAELKEAEEAPDPFAEPYRGDVFRKPSPTPVFDAKRYGDLFVESGMDPGIRSLTLGKKTYTKVQIIGRDRDGDVRLKTQQGEKIAKLSQLPQDWVAAIAAKEAAQGTAKTAAEKKILSIDEEIKARAAEEWPDDYAMQAYEYKRQREAWDEMRRYASSAALGKIVAKARREWPDNYTMQRYEVQRQLKGLEDLSK